MRTLFCNTCKRRTAHRDNGDAWECSEHRPPAHLRPESCYVCGGPKHRDTSPDGHKFWSNADAKRELLAQPHVDYSPEAAYVQQHRPY